LVYQHIKNYYLWKW